MASPSVPSLFELSSIRLTYSIWTLQDVTKWLSNEVFFEELVDIVLTDVQHLPIPEQTKPRIMQLVEPIGKHLLSLLGLWFSKVQIENSHKGLTGDMFFKCLVLNADGLINQRKTAEKLLRNCLLHNTFAFRLACTSFLEKEVLKLWPIVKLYFLNKIMLESEQPDPAKNDFYWAEGIVTEIGNNSFYSFNKFSKPQNAGLYKLYQTTNCRPTFPSTTEPYEVLFWISYCLSKENAMDLNRVPNFTENVGGWHKFFLEDATLSGNIACFDYFMNYSDKKPEYSHVEIIQKMFAIEDVDLKQPCFIFHFSQLDSEEIAEVFLKFPRRVMSHFLQWPLSVRFLENTEELWNLIPEGDKDWVFLKIFAVLFPRYCTLPSIKDSFFFSSVLEIRNFVGITGMYIAKHLRSIWVVLWKICHHSDKTPVLTSFVSTSIFSFVNAGQYSHLPEVYETSGLEDKLFNIFLANGEAVLEFYSADNLKESLRSLVAKHVPGDFENLDKRLFSFLDIKSFASRMNMVNMIPLNPDDYLQLLSYPIDIKFVCYIKDFLFSSYGIDKSLFHN